MADININEVYEELKYLGELPETSRLIKDYLALREADAKTRAALEVVKYALGESRIAICHICNIKHTCGHGTAKFDPCCIIKHIDSAIAAIRGVGGAE